MAQYINIYFSIESLITKVWAFALIRSFLEYDLRQNLMDQEVNWYFKLGLEVMRYVFTKYD